MSASINQAVSNVITVLLLVPRRILSEMASPNNITQEKFLGNSTLHTTTVSRKTFLHSWALFLRSLLLMQEGNAIELSTETKSYALFCL